MSNPWYRAWVGLVSDPKIGEAALIADVSVSLVIAVWHALLESASEVDDGGAFSTSARRISVILREPPARIEAVFAALGELGMVRDGEIVAWEKRQPVSESNADAAERQRQSRAARRAARPAAREAGAEKPAELPLAAPCHNLSQDVTAPESESETDRQDRTTRASAPAAVSDSRFEAECRKAAGSHPVAASPAFSPVLNFLDGGGEREDVLAALAEITADPRNRVKYWAGVVEFALHWRTRRLNSRQKIAAGLAAAPRAPPGGSVISLPARPPSRSSAANAAACTEFADEPGHFAHLANRQSGSFSGPVIEGRA